MPRPAVVSAELVLHLEDGRIVTYKIHHPDAASVRSLALAPRDENYGTPALGYARQFTMTFGWRNGVHHG